MAQGSRSSGRTTKTLPTRSQKVAATRKAPKANLKGVKNKKTFKKQKTAVKVKQRLESAIYGQIEEDLQQRASAEGRGFKVVKPTKKTPAKKKGKANRKKKSK